MGAGGDAGRLHRPGTYSKAMPTKGRTIKPTKYILTAQRNDSHREEVIYCPSKTAATKARQRLRREGWTWFHIYDCKLLP